MSEIDAYSWNPLLVLCVGPLQCHSSPWHQTLLPSPYSSVSRPCQIPMWTARLFRPRTLAPFTRLEGTAQCIVSYKPVTLQQCQGTADLSLRGGCKSVLCLLPWPIAIWSTLIKGVLFCSMSWEQSNLVGTVHAHTQS